MTERNQVMYPSHDNQERSYKDYIEVGMSEWKIARPGTLLLTEGLGPCIGLAIYNSKRKIAAMGHYPAASYTTNVIASNVRKFLTNSSIEDIKVYIRGGYLFRDYNVIADREAMIDILQQAGLNESQIDILWTENPDDFAAMNIDPKDGKFNYIIANEFDGQF